MGNFKQVAVGTEIVAQVREVVMREGQVIDSTPRRNTMSLHSNTRRDIFRGTIDLE